MSLSIEMLRNILTSNLPQHHEDFSFAVLPGQGSTRKYFRITYSNGDTYIVTTHPSKHSGEITSMTIEPPLDFIEVQKFFKRGGLPVPDLYGHAKSENVLIQEDLGDETLLKRIRLTTSRNDLFQWFTQAIDILLLLQSTALKISPFEKTSHFFFQRTFSAELMKREFDHFIEYGIQKRYGIKSLSHLEEWNDITANLIQNISAIPCILSHRDFQSTNLMVKNNQLKVIDFQDTFVAPIVYDLVALLRDSYVVLAWDMVEDLLHYYHQKASKEVFPNLHLDFSPSFDHLLSWFHYQTLQRKLKDIGRFEFFAHNNKNPNYLQYIASSFCYVVRACDGLEPGKKLKQWLMNHCIDFPVWY